MNTYTLSEMARLNRRLADLQRAPLCERKAAREDFARLLSDSQVLQERAEWLLNGTYGYAETVAAWRIVRASKRSNRVAMLSQLLAALESLCPPAEAVKAYKSLPPGAQTAANEVLSAVIAAAEQLPTSEQPVALE